MATWRGWLDGIREGITPVSHTSTFRTTGQITPEEFIQAGDYLVYKFPSWSWASASSKAQEVKHLPSDKQYLVTRGVPCRRRLDENFAGDAGKGETVISGEEGEEDWLNTGGERRQAHERDVKALEGSQGDVEQGMDDEEEIPDMDDEDDDEAIIRDHSAGGTNAPLRTYSLYITYTTYYRTPRMYLSGYASPGVPLPPSKMLDDIVGDYKDKTVTLEDFPFFDTSVKMASIHPCRHASVMKTLLDRADAAMKIRKMREKRSQSSGQTEVDALAGDAKQLSLGKGDSDLSAKAGDEWEVLEQDDDAEVAIRVDQYIVVFLKFMASVTPGIEHDQTMGV